MIGQLLVLGAFAVWGLAPLYFHYVEIDSILVLMALRILWQGVIVLGLLKLSGFRFRSLRGVTFKGVIYTVLGGCVLNISWYGFIYALTNNLVLSSSLAYFICPLLVIGASSVFFSEPLSKSQKWSISLMLISLSWLLFHSASVLWLPVMIAVAFTSYFVLRKWSGLYGTQSIALEHIAQLFLVPFILLASPDWTVASLVDLQLTAFIVAVIQVVPILLLAVSVNRVPLQQIGIIQYIEPTLHFALGYFVFKEHLNLDMLISMLGVWVAVSVWMAPALRQSIKIKNITTTV